MQSPNGAYKPSGNPVDHFKQLPSQNKNNKTFKCNYCEKTFDGSASRCLTHLTGEGTGVARCTSCPDDVVQALLATKAAKDSDASKKRKGKQAQQETGGSKRTAYPGAAGGSQISAAFARANAKSAHAAMAEFIFMEGLPMRIVKSSYLRKAIDAAAAVPGNKPPAYNTLRTTLLSEAKQRMESRLTVWDDRTIDTGATICSDGWSDAQNRPLLNILAVNPKGAKFLTAVDTSGETKSASYIAAELIEAIKDVGPDLVVQVCTDNAASCRAAGKIIMDTYPHITWSPCVAHVCDLALEGIFRLHYFQEVYTETKAYVGFINNHHTTLAAWRAHTSAAIDTSSMTPQEAANAKSEANKNLQLLRPGETRFASAFLMLERTRAVKAKLQQFVVSDAWETVVGGMRSQDKAAAEECKATILSSNHWRVVEESVELCEPIVVLLRHADGNAPSASKVHYYAAKVKTALGNATALPATVQAAVEEIWEGRWAYMDSPIHGAAYCLDPEFWGDRGLRLENRGDSCVRDLRVMFDRLLSEEEAREARLSYMSFRSREREFADAHALTDADSMPAHQWWEMYGGAHPALQRVAIRLVSQVSSACSCERNWLAYDFIHNRRRNRLTSARARDLVYVFTNGRLANGFNQSEEGFIGWDDEEEMLEPAV